MSAEMLVTESCPALYNLVIEVYIFISFLVVVFGNFFNSNKFYNPSSFSLWDLIAVILFFPGVIIFLVLLITSLLLKLLYEFINMVVRKLDSIKIIG